MFCVGGFPQKLVLRFNMSNSIGFSLSSLSDEIGNLVFSICVPPSSMNNERLSKGVNRYPKFGNTPVAIFHQLALLVEVSLPCD